MFTEQRIGSRRRQRVIGQEGVHGRHAGRVAVAEQIGDLHWGGPAGEDQQPVAGRVAGHVHQHVDPVPADQRRQVCVADPDRRAPVVCHGAEACRGGVFHRHFRIAGQLDDAAIERRQQRLGEQGGGVVAEVGGDEADTQAPPFGAIERERRVLRQAARVAGVPVAVFGEDRLGREVVAVVQREQQVAVARGVVGPQASGRGDDRPRFPRGAPASARRQRDW